jgi:sulfonate transport system substrate-binding protein
MSRSRGHVSPMSRSRGHSRLAALIASTAALALALALAAGACASSGTSTAPAAATGSATAADLSSVTLRIGATGWNSYEAALKVAGLDDTPYHVKWSVFSGGNLQLQALQSGALDVADSSEIPPIFVAVGGRVNFKVVAVQKANTLLQELVVGKGSTITSVAQLKGKKVGYVQNTTAQYFLDKLLTQAGLSWKDITAAPLTPSDGVAALNSGSIAALAGYGNSIITAHAAGATTIGSGQDILSGNFPWEASNSLIANSGQRAALIDLFIRLNKAYAYIRDGHQQAYAQATATATHQPVSAALSQFEAGEKEQQTRIVPTSAAAIASEQSVADTFTGIGALPKAVTVSAFWSDALNADLTTALTAAGEPAS